MNHKFHIWVTQWMMFNKNRRRNMLMEKRWFPFRCSEFEMPLEHPSGHVPLATGYMTHRRFGLEIWIRSHQSKGGTRMGEMNKEDHTKCKEM